MSKLKDISRIADHCIEINRLENEADLIMAALRYGTELFWTSLIVPWALSAATIALVLLRQAKLDTVANLGKLTAAVHGAPVPSTLDDASDLAV